MGQELGSLLEELAMDMQWSDHDIHSDIKSGFKLVGMRNRRGCSDIKPRSLSENDLMKQLKFLQPPLSPKADYEQDLWDMTMQELTEKAWLERS